MPGCDLKVWKALEVKSIFRLNLLRFVKRTMHKRHFRFCLSHLSNEDTVSLHPGDNPGPVELQASLGISLDILISIAELGNQDVEQDDDTGKKEEDQFPAQIQPPLYLSPRGDPFAPG